jgi:predicted RNA-binding protein Jag
MRDQVFTGRDVSEALAAAGRALGLPAATLRHLVLDAGLPATGSSPGRPAQVAVLLDRGGKEGGAPPVVQAPATPEADPRGLVRALIRALAEAADIDVEAEAEGSPETTLRVRIVGEGCGFFLDHDGEVLEALQHLLQRALALRQDGPARLVLECEGYRERRDAALTAEALEVAAAVRADGQARLLGPLNSYERRIVHVALAEEPGVRTFSVGEGGERRVTVAPAEPGGAGG